MFSELEALSITCASHNLGFWLPRPLLAELVSNLLVSCESLEIDTQNPDKGQHDGSKNHLCAAICAILPRLRNLCLRLSALCCSLLGDDLDPENRNEDSDIRRESSNREWTVYPNLRSLVINCSIGVNDYTGICPPAVPIDNGTQQAQGIPTVQTVPKACIILVKTMRPLYDFPTILFPFCSTSARGRRASQAVPFSLQPRIIGKRSNSRYHRWKNATGSVEPPVIQSKSRRPKGT